MSEDRFDRTLSEALTHDEETASPQFTAEVLARIEQPRSRLPLLRRPALATGLAVVLIAIGVTLGVGFKGRIESPSPAVSEREQLVREYRELEQELARLRQLADESRPVLYLGGDETFDVMYDLGGYENLPEANAVRPVSLPPDRG